MKTRLIAIVAGLLCLCTFGLTVAARAADEFKGTWTLERSEQADQVEFGLAYHRFGHDSRSESNWALSEFQGLDIATTPRHDVQFSITRDAGRFNCDGFIQDHAGAGTFQFVADASFVQRMGALGFTGIDQEKQFAMAVHDVSLAFAKDMRGETLTGLDSDKLIAFRVHGVTLRFARELRAAGITAPDSDKLIAFRIHGVTAAMVREVRKNGIQPSDDELIAMRIHGVTPEFIASIGKLGYQHPTADELVAMRIHGVTPEYIADLQSRGVKHLSVDQLVSLRIHGID